MDILLIVFVLIFHATTSRKDSFIGTQQAQPHQVLSFRTTKEYGRSSSGDILPKMQFLVHFFNTNILNLLTPLYFVCLRILIYNTVYTHKLNIPLKNSTCKQLQFTFISMWALRVIPLLAHINFHFHLVVFATSAFQVC